MSAQPRARTQRIACAAIPTASNQGLSMTRSNSRRGFKSRLTPTTDAQALLSRPKGKASRQSMRPATRAAVQLKADSSQSSWAGKVNGGDNNCSTEATRPSTARSDSDTDEDMMPKGPVIVWEDEFVELAPLRFKVEDIARSHNLQAIKSDVLHYLSQVTQMRAQALVKGMINAAKHRVESNKDSIVSPPPHPGVPFPDVIGSGESSTHFTVVFKHAVKDQLMAIERVERGEELQRKDRLGHAEEASLFMEELRQECCLSAPQRSSHSKTTTPKPSKMPLTIGAMNQTAIKLAGGLARNYSWMDTMLALRVRPSPFQEGVAAAEAEASTDQGQTLRIGGHARSAASRVTVKDALFWLEHELEHGGGRGQGRVEQTLIGSYVRRLA